jgi:hypothetical protein
MIDAQRGRAVQAYHHEHPELDARDLATHDLARRVAETGLSASRPSAG